MNQMFRNFLLSVLIILPLEANAHSPLSSSFPSDGERLDAPPVEIIMDFKASAKLIKVELMKSKRKRNNGFLGELFGGNNDEPVLLGKSFLMLMNKRHIIPMPSLGEGDYLFRWRAMGEDGHVIKGDFTFKVGVK
jgi:methionine-rich copper-binding protein CopC